MLALMLLMSGVGTVVPHEIHADPAPLLAATRGLVRDATPRLDYDLEALADYRGDTPQRFRLDYAGVDELGHGPGARDLVTAYQLAADLSRAQDEAVRVADGR